MVRHVRRPGNTDTSVQRGLGPRLALHQATILGPVGVIVLLFFVNSADSKHRPRGVAARWKLGDYLSEHGSRAIGLVFLPENQRQVIERRRRLRAKGRD